MQFLVFLPLPALLTHVLASRCCLKRDDFTLGMNRHSLIQRIQLFPSEASPIPVVALNDCASDNNTACWNHGEAPVAVCVSAVGLRLPEETDVKILNGFAELTCISQGRCSLVQPCLDLWVRTSEVLRSMFHLFSVIVVLWPGKRPGPCLFSVLSHL